MRKKIIKIIVFHFIISLFFQSIFAQKQQFPYSVSQLLNEPIIFAEGKVKTTNGIAFTRDGKTLYISQFIAEKDYRGRPHSRIFESNFVNGNWTEPKQVSFSSKFTDYQAVLSPDGKKLFFNSSRPHPNSGSDSEETKINIWFVEHTKKGWSEPRYIEELNTPDYHEGYVSITKNNTLYFTSDRPNGNRQLDIYRSEFRQGRYQNPENVKGLNSEASENDLFVDPHERFIIFNRSYTGSTEVDLWISFRNKGVWTAPRKLDKVNTPKWNLSPTVSPDGKYFFYMVQSVIRQIDLDALIFRDEPYPSGRLEREANSTQSLKEFVQMVTGNKGSNEEKTRKLVTWINTNFKWSYTDYQKRTVEEIIQRRAGNCAELANVLAALLTEANIQFRWISEINIQPRRESRLKTAMQKVTENGNRMSVFGLMHNDHVWLEVQNEKDKSWFPADPAVGVVGLKEWISARMKFMNRAISPIPEVAKVVEEMFVPFVVVAKEKRNTKPVEIRSNFYLIDGFNSFYKKKLTKLESWKEWNEKVAKIADTGRGAFAGEINLHEHEKEIEEIWQAFQKLKEEALKRKIS